MPDTVNISDVKTIQDVRNYCATHDNQLSSAWGDLLYELDECNIKWSMLAFNQEVRELERRGKIIVEK